MKTLGGSTGRWVSYSEAGRRLGISAVAVKKQVDRLVLEGKLRTEAGPNNAKLIDFKVYERLRQESDGVRSANGKRGGSDGPKVKDAGLRRTAAVLSDEQARKTGIQADLAQLALDERQGKLLRTEEVVRALENASVGLVSALESLPGRTGDIVVAFQERGEAGIRALLKEAVLTIRRKMATSMQAIVERENHEEARSDA